MMEELLKWIGDKEEILIEKENEPIPDDDYEEVMKLLEDHKGFQEEMAKKQPTYDRLTKSVKRRGSVVPAASASPVQVQVTPEHKQGRRPSSRIPKLASPATSFTRERSRDKLTSPGSSFTRSGSTTLDKNHPALLHLSKRWQHLWLLSMERLRRLQEKLERIAIVSTTPCRTGELFYEIFAVVRKRESFLEMKFVTHAVSLFYLSCTLYKEERPSCRCAVSFRLFSTPSSLWMVILFSVNKCFKMCR